MSNQKNYLASIALTKLHSAIITTKKGAKCILIPIEANYLTEKDDAVYLNLNILVRAEPDTLGQDGFIGHKLSSEKYKELGAEKAKEIKLPIIGNIKHFAPQNNDSENTTHIAEPMNPEEDDDLPFN